MSLYETDKVADQAFSWFACIAKAQTARQMAMRVAQETYNEDTIAAKRGLDQLVELYGERAMEEAIKTCNVPRQATLLTHYLEPYRIDAMPQGMRLLWKLSNGQKMPITIPWNKLMETRA